MNINVIEVPTLWEAIGRANMGAFWFHCEHVSTHSEDTVENRMGTNGHFQNEDTVQLCDDCEEEIELPIDDSYSEDDGDE